MRKSGRHFWAIWGNFGPFWVTLDHFGSYLGHFGPFWVIFGPFGQKSAENFKFFLRDVCERHQEYKRALRVNLLLAQFGAVEICMIC